MALAARPCAEPPGLRFSQGDRAPAAASRWCTDGEDGHGRSPHGRFDAMVSAFVLACRPTVSAYVRAAVGVSVAVAVRTRNTLRLLGRCACATHRAEVLGSRLGGPPVWVHLFLSAVADVRAVSVGSAGFAPDGFAIGKSQRFWVLVAFAAGHRADLCRARSGLGRRAVFDRPRLGAAGLDRTSGRQSTDWRAGFARRLPTDQPGRFDRA